MNRVAIIVFTIFLLNYTTGQAETIRELGKRVNWNDGKQKDFILTVRYKQDGIVFCPSFIVHPIGREEDFPKDMDTVELNEPNLSPR